MIVATGSTISESSSVSSASLAATIRPALNSIETAATAPRTEQDATIHSIMLRVRLTKTSMYTALNARPLAEAGGGNVSNKFSRVSRVVRRDEGLRPIEAGAW